jgi:hypothetical protein
MRNGRSGGLDRRPWIFGALTGADAFREDIAALNTAARTTTNNAHAAVHRQKRRVRSSFHSRIVMSSSHFTRVASGRIQP